MPRILVIDDDEAVREVMQMMLEELGHVVEVASEGEEGLRKHEKTPADIVITDLHMPGKNGFETLKELRESAEDVKVIAMSGADTYMVERNLESSRINGADGTLQKPFEFPDLIAAIERVL